MRTVCLSRAPSVCDTQGRCSTALHGGGRSATMRGPVGPLVLAEPWSEGFDALILANVTESYEGA